MLFTTIYSPFYKINRRIYFCSISPPRHQAANEGDHNGAKEANSNTNEIPLPDNILPPI
jgi:hypothetical protein